MIFLICFLTCRVFIHEYELVVIHVIREHRKDIYFQSLYRDVFKKYNTVHEFPVFLIEKRGHTLARDQIKSVGMTIIPTHHLKYIFRFRIHIDIIKDYDELAFFFLKWPIDYNFFHNLFSSKYICDELLFSRFVLHWFHVKIKIFKRLRVIDEILITVRRIIFSVFLDICFHRRNKKYFCFIRREILCYLLA